jgi:hypothetical protein
LIQTNRQALSITGTSFVNRHQIPHRHSQALREIIKTDLPRHHDHRVFLQFFAKLIQRFAEQGQIQTTGTIINGSNANVVAFFGHSNTGIHHQTAGSAHLSTIIRC